MTIKKGFSGGFYVNTFICIFCLSAWYVKNESIKTAGIVEYVNLLKCKNVLILCFCTVKTVHQKVVEGTCFSICVCKTKVGMVQQVAVATSEAAALGNRLLLHRSAVNSI